MLKFQQQHDTNKNTDIQHVELSLLSTHTRARLGNIINLSQNSNSVKIKLSTCNLYKIL